MLRLGIIGTGSIAHSFIEAAHLSGHYQFTTLYSRKEETAQNFVENYPNTIDCFTDFEHFLKSDCQVVYIASPNSLHFQQAKDCLLANKHVIIEKPAVTRTEEWAELVALAQERNLYLFEAARNYHEHAFQVIKDFLADKKILGAHFSYAKYSSKMPDLLAGKNPNVFSNVFAGGALMDLGIYPLYAAIRLFGQPLASRYQVQQLDNSIDLNGTGSLTYPDFQVAILAGKNITSFLPSEIYTDKGTLVLNSIEYVKEATFYDLTGQETRLPIQESQHNMLEEATAFASAIQGHNSQAYQVWLQAARAVHETLYTMRQDAHIIFKVEQDEN